MNDLRQLASAQQMRNVVPSPACTEAMICNFPLLHSLQTATASRMDCKHCKSAILLPCTLAWVSKSSSSDDEPLSGLEGKSSSEAELLSCSSQSGFELSFLAEAHRNFVHPLYRHIFHWQVWRGLPGPEILTLRSPTASTHATCTEVTQVKGKFRIQ